MKSTNNNIDAFNSFKERINPGIFLDEFDDPILFLNKDFSIRYSNETCLVDLQYTLEDLISRSYFDLLPASECPKVGKTLNDCLENLNTKYFCEHVAVTGSGRLESFKTSAISGKLDDQDIYIMLHMKNVSDIKREKELSETAAVLYEAICEQASECFYMHNFDGRLIQVNQHACDTLGYTREELLSMTVMDVEQDFDLPNAQAEWSKIKPGVRFTLNGHQKRKDGTTFPVVVSFGCVVLNGEKFYLGLARDMTDVEQTEEKYRLMVESAPDPIFIQTNKNFAYLNPAACTFFGVDSPSELLGTPVLNRVHNDYKSKGSERIQQLNINRKSVSELTEVQFIRKDGSYAWAQTKGEPIIFNGNNGALVFVRDTTMRKAAEDELKISQNKYATLFNKSSIPIVLAAFPEHTIVEANEAMIDSIGFRRSELIGKTLYDLGIICVNDKVNSIWEDISNNGYIENKEFNVFTKSRDELTVLISVHLIDIENERHELITIHDITERKRSETKLFEISEKFQKVFDYSAVGMCLTSLDGLLIDVNKKMCEMFCYDKVGLAAKHFTDITYPDDIEISNDAIQKMVSGDVKFISYEKRYTRSNGEVFWGSATSTVLRREDGTPIHFISQIQDISKRKQLEEELLAKDRFNQAVMDNLPIGISVNSVFPDVEFGYMNDNFPLFYRTTRDKLNNPDAFWEAVYEDPEFRELIKTKVLEDVQSGDQKKMRWEHVPITRKGAETSYITAYNAHVPDKNLFISIVTDETERVRSVETIKRNAERLLAIHEFDLAILKGFESYSSIGENAAKYIFTLLKPDIVEIGILRFEDTVMQVVKVHQTMGVIDSYDMSVGKTDQEKLDMIDSLPSSPISEICTPEVVTKIFKCNGHCNCFNLPIYYGDRFMGIINLGYVSSRELSAGDIETLQDVVTQIAMAIELKRLMTVAESYATRLEEMIDERTAQLEAAIKELEAFTYSVSHDLRAPLRSISGFVRILNEDYGSSLDDEGKRICNVISNSAQQMGQLIDDLLSLSKVGRSSMVLIPVNMEMIINDLFVELTTESMRKHINFSVGQLPIALADPKLIRQVWINLLDNAIKFSSKKPVSQICVEGECIGNEVIYSISDNGAGFNMKYRDKLFGIFQRLHSTNDFEGTGVGLAIVQRIVNRHGGRVWAQSEEYKGATFYFSLLKEAETNVDGTC